MWWIRFKDTKELFIFTTRTGVSKNYGRYGLGYRDLARVIAALKTSRELVRRGASWKDLELVNINGRTMQDMIDYPVEEGFALRHKTEKWYWSTVNHGRVWYRRAGDVEGAWRKNDALEAIQEGRDERTSPTTQKLQMVQGFANGAVSVLANWFPWKTPKLPKPMGLTVRQQKRLGISGVQGASLNARNKRLNHLLHNTT